MQRFEEQRLAIQLLSRLDSLINAATKLGVAYVGWQATGHWTGALTTLIALRLAEGNNLAAGIAGTATLATVGLTQLLRAMPVGEASQRLYLTY